MNVLTGSPFFHPLGAKGISLLLLAISAGLLHGPMAMGPTAMAGASEGETHLLWPAGAPAAGGDEVEDQPRLILHRADSQEPTAIVVVCPGGGYGTLATQHEGDDIAAWLNELGITAAILIYRHGGKGNRGEGYRHPVPLGDAQRAVRMVRARAEAWNVDPARVGILGFSAGGHLASTVCTQPFAGDPQADDPIDRVSARPDFAILGYPVISLEKAVAHRGSRRNLLGESPDPSLVRRLSSELQVTADTPPTFLWHTSEDAGVPAENSIEYYLALRRAEVPAELHVFERGRHGLGLARGHEGTEYWPELCRAWMVNRGVLRER